MSDQNERRDLHFDDLHQVLADAETLANGEVRTTGNHSFGQILEHLALAHDVSSGKLTPPKAPFAMRLMRPLIRMMVINSKPLQPGVKLPASGESFFWPDRAIDVQDALAHLRESVDHYYQQGPIANHPFFGKLTPEQNLSLNTRHGALHLSFVHPVS